MKWGSSHLSVELDSQDVVGVAVVADLRPLLEVVDVHALRHGGAHHDYQTAGEQTLHDVDIWSLCWERTWSRQTGSHRDTALMVTSPKYYSHPRGRH